MNLQRPKASSTNICINCKHHHHDGSEKFADRCLRTDNGINPVNGQIISRSCDNERFSSHGEACGTAGRYFVERIASANSCTAQDSALTP